MKSHNLVMSLLCVIAMSANAKGEAPSNGGGAALQTAQRQAAADEVKGPALELFGVKLKGADRSSLRSAFKTGGMSPVREQDGHWIDTYNPRGALEGASSFEAGYVGRSGKFAYAEYKFNSFMDSAQVGKIAQMAKHKYGEPTRSSGHEKVGPVSYEWELPNKMIVRVSRAWPDTSTSLSYADLQTLDEMRQEQSAQQSRREESKAREQSNAF